MGFRVMNALQKTREKREKRIRKPSEYQTRDVTRESVQGRVVGDHEVPIRQR